MKKPIVTGIGEIVWDVLPGGARLGGAPLNFAFMADRLGCEGRIISAVGRDDLGTTTLKEIESLGISTAGIQQNGFPTGKVLVELDADGIPNYNIKEGSSWDNIALRQEDLDTVAASDAVCWGILSQRNGVSAGTIARLLSAARKDCLKVFDINIRQNFYTRDGIAASLQLCDALKLNEDELPLVAGLFCPEADEPVKEIAARFGIRTVILTKGADCSEIYEGGKLVSHIDTPKVKVADTVGAGDSFTACYVSRILAGTGIRKAHEDAVRLSAYICTCDGAINEPVLTTPGIVHFGVGGFHRAHLEFYTHSLIEACPDQRCWGISGAMILPFDESLYTRLKSQGGVYTLSAFAPDGSHTFTEIHSLVELNWGIQDRESIISRLASPEIKIITLTITEGGYVLDGADENSVFGYVCEALERRMADNLPVTILSCDNLQHNGDTARRTFIGYFKAHNPKVAEWAESNVTFPNSMVDRITPASKPADIERLNALNGTDDKAPVFCEDFIQWVVEDKFIAGRPAWEKVGVQFTDDVSAYENMKLSLLNASHTLLSYPAALEGIKKVDEVLRIEKYRKLIRDFMDKDITCYVPAPEGIDLGAYKDKLLSRFGNPAISDQVARLCSDGMAKFAVYVVPNLKKALADGHDMERFAFLIASYWRYISTARTLDGEAIEIVEPHLTDRDRELIKNGSARDFLSASAFADCKFNNEFYNLYDKYVKDCEFYHIAA